MEKGNFGVGDAVLPSCILTMGLIIYIHVLHLRRHRDYMICVAYWGKLNSGPVNTGKNCDYLTIRFRNLYAL